MIGTSTVTQKPHSGVEQSQLARISNTDEVVIAPTARAFTPVQNQFLSHVGDTRPFPHFILFEIIERMPHLQNVENAFQTYFTRISALYMKGVDVSYRKLSERLVVEIWAHNLPTSPSIFPYFVLIHTSIQIFADAFPFATHLNEMSHLITSWIRSIPMDLELTKERLTEEYRTFTKSFEFRMFCKSYPKQNRLKKKEPSQPLTPVRGSFDPPTPRRTDQQS